MIERDTAIHRDGITRKLEGRLGTRSVRVTVAMMKIERKTRQVIIETYCALPLTKKSRLETCHVEGDGRYEVRESLSSTAVVLTC